MNKLNGANHQQWWRGAVIYQIYPRSFNDTNDDGIGDLQGIIDKIPYIKSLGVDGIWISPFFVSPMKDFGYDVADYCDVDPMFGDIDVFKSLIQCAHEHDLKVIIDQVYSHTSDQHAWFQQSRTNKTNDRADWYVWAQPKADGTPPNNWQSVFGGSSWTWDNLRKQYYLHNFLSSQPDLNLHNRQVQQALINVAKFWLGLGVDGFRLDAINFGMHDQQLRDNPPNPNVEPKYCRPYTMQQHIHNMSHSNMPQFLAKLRATIDTYGQHFTVAEVGGASPTEIMKQYTQGNTRLNSAYSFEFLSLPNISKSAFVDVVSNWKGDHKEGWPAWAFSNHDAPRVISRWAPDHCTHSRAELYLALLLCMRGNVFIYQGEELGLPQAEVPFEDLQDPEAIANWPDNLGRDGARTPIPWNGSGEFCGFSNTQPWLPIDPRHQALSCEQQLTSSNSTLARFKQIMQLRNRNPALRFGDFMLVDNATELLVFRRQSENDAVLCVFNLTDAPIKESFAGVRERLLQSQDADWLEDDVFPSQSYAIFAIT